MRPGRATTRHPYDCLACSNTGTYFALDASDYSPDTGSGADSYTVSYSLTRARAFSQANGRAHPRPYYHTQTDARANPDSGVDSHTYAPAYSDSDAYPHAAAHSNTYSSTEGYTHT